jgi:hypothetical protein
MRLGRRLASGWAFATYLARKMEGKAKIPVAASTPTSIDWTPGRLLAHLAKERAAPEGGR